MKTLLLDQSYAPVDVIDWQRAVTLLLSGKAEALEETETIIRSPSLQIRVPRVMRLIRAKARKLKAAFSKKAVLLRDANTCCYCAQVFSPKVLTLDHVIPRCLGGKHDWLNVVAACEKCNFKKGGRTPAQAGMGMHYQPKAPARLELLYAALGDFTDWVQKRTQS